MVRGNTVESQAQGFFVGGEVPKPGGGSGPATHRLNRHILIKGNTIARSILAPLIVTSAVDVTIVDNSFPDLLPPDAKKYCDWEVQGKHIQVRNLSFSNFFGKLLQTTSLDCPGLAQACRAGARGWP